MLSIYFKELRSFFSSIAGYVVLLVFLTACGVFLWVLTDTSIPDYGYASMDQFFSIAPWLLLFLIPAITMRSFADEYRGGTIEWLSTKPISPSQIIFGKFLASFTLVCIALLPTLIYVFSIHYLAMDDAALDAGGITGSYIGLLFLVATFTAIGIFGSTLTDNQVVSFLVALFLCFLLYFGFEALSRVPAFSGGPDYYLGLFGADEHYHSMSRGVIDTRDVIYFSSLVALFIALTRFTLVRKKA
ncbi:gliding motility-associated ABC transporter permease subunit GldF [Taibaiella koreensis]|uniref:gliding motility-associated ABC transporter permease subunit GldF n=1 Tax=Taibaiella koreensis TaxID=1268548 RepID=UPI000E59B4EA|nr:gliding motility-associated ABC transporter permease subunit GldF [Taibaiella koreensis]